MQTEEVSIVQLKADIEKLEAQRDTLKRTIDAYALQTEELYQKRSLVAQECEVLKLGIEDERKKISQERGALEAQKREIQGLETKQKQGLVRLNEDKEQFKKDRVVYHTRLKELEDSEKEIFKTKESLKKREAELAEGVSDLQSREKRFQSEISVLKDELTNAINSAKSAESSAKQESEKSNAQYEHYLKTVENAAKSRESEKEAFDKKKKEWEADTAARTEAIRKRELALVQKEKDAENLKLEYKAKIEDFEIEQARKREEKPEVKKPKKEK